MVDGSTVIRTDSGRVYNERQQLDGGLQSELLGHEMPDVTVYGNGYYIVAFEPAPTYTCIVVDSDTKPFSDYNLMGRILIQKRPIDPDKSYWLKGSEDWLSNLQQAQLDASYSDSMGWATFESGIDNRLAHPSLKDFAKGIDGVQPELWVVEAASRITKVALDKTLQPEIAVDVDGALSFDLRLADGRIVFAELEPSGQLDASVYDQNGVNVGCLRKITDVELVAWF